jgi:site-specific DNA-methyltransferase (cytosine-N4-specific)
VVTSPPYYGLRDYGHPRQYGLELAAEDYISHLRGVFREVHRVLADRGTCWLVVGDGYTANSDGSRRGRGHPRHQPPTRPKARPASPPKNLLGIPWRMAFALQEDGWILRNAIVWHKPNAMPESVRDRLSCRHEHIFLLVKQRHYHFDLDPIRVPYVGDRALSRRAHHSANRATTARGVWPPIGGHRAGPGHSRSSTNHAGVPAGASKRSRSAAGGRGGVAGRNPGDVWSIGTTPFTGAHFAVFPIEIPRRCIAAGCPPGGTVLDPFSGAATTGIAAHRLGHPYIGIDLRADYHDLAIARLRDDEGAHP